MKDKDEFWLQTLREPFQTKARLVFYRMKERMKSATDAYVVVRDGYRTKEQQWALYAKGRKWTAAGWEMDRSKGKIVTRAKPSLAPHCYRSAVHIVLLDTKGTEWGGDDIWLSDKDVRWKWVGEEAARAELTWLGNHPLRDMAHIEDQAWQAYARIRNFVPLEPEDAYV